MIHATKSKVTGTIGGAVVAAFFAFATPVAWSQLGSIPAGAPTTPAGTAPATLTIPAATADGTATTVAAKTKGLHFVTGPTDAQQLIADEQFN
jgi:hypothetical protein